TDPDTGQNLFEAPASLAGAYGTFTFNATTGVWGYTLNNAALNVQALNTGDVVYDTLTVKSIDGTATQVIQVTINGLDEPGVPLTVNDTTSADGRYAMSRNSDSPNTINLDASSLFSGGTGAVAYTYQLVSAPASTSWLSIVGGVISGNPSDSHAGNYIYKVTATDSAGSISTYIALTVLPDSGWNVETVGGNISAANLFFQSNGFHDVVTFTGANTVEANAGSLIDVMLGQGGTNTMNGGSGDDALYGMGGNDILKGGDGNDFIDGGAGNDILVGGAGNDTLVGGSGNDQFRIASDSGSDIIADFLPGTDKIGLLDTGSTGSGSVNFANTIGTSAGAALNPLDFITRGSVNTVVNSDDNSVVVITSTQTNSQITTTTIGSNVSSTAVNTYIVVFNSTSNAAEIWFDNNWSTTGGRTLIATLHGVTAAQVAAMTAADFVVYNNAADPIILDLDGNGFTFGAPVLFDINGDGAKDRVAWNTSGDGMLAFDLNGDGVINDGTELFTPWFNGGAFDSGAQALASLDTNGDGVIDMNDAAFANLLIWNDVNADGVSDAGELTSLAANGIASISVSTTQTVGEIDGQTVIGEGTFTRVDGSTGSFIEVELDTSLGTLGGDGDEFLISGSGGNTLTGGAGADTFVFDATALADVMAGGGILDLIADYNFLEGDVVDLSALLAGQSVGDANKAEYVRMEGDFLTIDIDGAANGENFVEIAQFSAAPGPDALRILVDDATNTTVII
ncbi:MAG: VCBS domain-containing protein, partial [Hoeflea sp.]|nr:VCBS domain-containing protein [Hoeflea sp.]